MPALAGAEPGIPEPSRDVTRFCRSRAQRLVSTIYGVSNDETDLSTKSFGAQAPSRLPRTHGDQRRHQGACQAACKRPQASERLTFIGGASSADSSNTVFSSSHFAGQDVQMRLVTLKKRREFLKVRGGSRWSTPSATVECKLRSPASCNRTDGDLNSNSENGAVGPPRFGFTVTKKVGGAVIRNRIRRRLKAVISELSDHHARAGFDYVLIARTTALDRPYAALKKDLEVALQRVHHPRRTRRPPSTSDRR